MTPSRDEDRLDRAFLALADPVRRGMIARLSRGPATVNELADPLSITKQAVSRHIQVLEKAELVTRSKDAQRRPVHLNGTQLESLTTWIDTYRLIHERQFRSLDAVLEAMKDPPVSAPPILGDPAHARKKEDK
ncbi:MAG: transcriptional regulator, ArsR family [Cryobacterium sp.]|jgi:DNA-binding transcriptional ArsR family regulator|nr:transcriptional regulator, ArsR family [Cryobacterium sp.]